MPVDTLTPLTLQEYAKIRNEISKKRGNKTRPPLMWKRDYEYLYLPNFKNKDPVTLHVYHGIDSGSGKVSNTRTSINPHRVICSYLRSSHSVDSDLLLSVYASNMYDKDAGFKTTFLIGLLSFLAGSADITRDTEKRALDFIHSGKPQEAVNLVIDNSKKYKNKLTDMFKDMSKGSPETAPGKKIEKPKSKVKPIIKYEPEPEKIRPKTDDKKIIAVAEAIEKVKASVSDTSWFMSYSSMYLAEKYRKIEPRLTPQEKNVFYKKFLDLAKKYGQGDPWVKKVMSGTKDWPAYERN